MLYVSVCFLVGAPSGMVTRCRIAAPIAAPIATAIPPASSAVPKPAPATAPAAPSSPAATLPPPASAARISAAAAAPPVANAARISPAAVVPLNAIRSVLPDSRLAATPTSFTPILSTCSLDRTSIAPASSVIGRAMAGGNLATKPRKSLMIRSSSSPPAVIPGTMTFRTWPMLPISGGFTAFTVETQVGHRRGVTLVPILLVLHTAR